MLIKSNNLLQLVTSTPGHIEELKVLEMSLNKEGFLSKSFLLLTPISRQKQDRDRAAWQDALDLAFYDHQGRGAHAQRADQPTQEDAIDLEVHPVLHGNTGSSEQ